MAAQLGVLVCIGTASPIERIPVFLWALTGMTVSYASLVKSHLMKTANNKTSRSAPRTRDHAELHRQAS